MKKTILLIEDDTTLQELLSQLLSRKGYSVIGCRDGIRACEYVAKFEPDMIVSDLNLPGYSGLEITRIVRANSAFSHIPVLLMSAHPGRTPGIDATKAGADGYIAKPFNINELSDKISDIFSRNAFQPDLAAS